MIKVDAIKDLGLITPTTGTNALDLRDLLADHVVGAGPGSLANLPNFGPSGANTPAQSATLGQPVDPAAGAVAAGSVVSAPDHNVALASMNMIGITTPDQQMIQDLLTRPKPVD